MKDPNDAWPEFLDQVERLGNMLDVTRASSPSGLADWCVFTVEAVEKFVRDEQRREWRLAHDETQRLASLPGHTLESAQRESARRLSVHLRAISDGLDEGELHTLAFEAARRLRVEDIPEAPDGDVVWARQKLYLLALADRCRQYEAAQLRQRGSKVERVDEAMRLRLIRLEEETDDEQSAYSAGWWADEAAALLSDFEGKPVSVSKSQVAKTKTWRAMMKRREELRRAIIRSTATLKDVPDDIERLG